MVADSDHQNQALTLLVLLRRENNMSFIEIVWKNFKSNIRKYLSYYLCCSFSIIVLFMFLSVYYNKNLQDEIANKNTFVIMEFSIAVLVLFILFFTVYALSGFLKQRSKEFGLYLVLGMRLKQMAKLIILEMIILVVVSVITGWLVGTLFSWAFFQTVINVLGIGKVGFYVDFRSYLYTAALFAVIMPFEAFFAFLFLKRLEIIDVIKHQRKVEAKGSGNGFNLISGLFGIVLIFFGYWRLEMRISNIKGFSFDIPEVRLFFLCSVAGLILIITQLGTGIIGLMPRFRNFYYKNLLGITQLKSRLNQNKRIIIIVSLLTMLMIFFVGSTYSLLRQADELSERQQPYDIVIPVMDEGKDLITGEIHKLMEESDSGLKDIKTMDYLYGYRDDGFEEIELTVISREQYYEFTGENLDIPEGKTVELVMDESAPENTVFPYDKITLTFGDSSYEFGFIGEEQKVLINLKVQPYLFMMILNDKDFKDIKNQVPSCYSGTYYMLNFTERTEAETITGLAEKLRSMEEEANRSSEIQMPFLLKTISRLEYKRQLMLEATMRFFVTGFLGLLFLMSAGCVLYLKIINETEALRIMYKKLYIIGITSKEFIRMVSTELSVVFFSPAILGGFTGYLFLKTATHHTTAEQAIKLNVWVVILANFIFQLVYYFLTRRRIIKRITVKAFG